MTVTRSASVRPASFVGALVVLVAVHVLQVGSIEGATGAIGRVLLHSLDAVEGCEDPSAPAARPHPLVSANWEAYEAALERLAASGVPRNKQPGELSARLLRGGGDNALESLGGRVPPERALQLVALTVPLRASGPAQDLVFEPGSMGVSWCG